MGVTRAGHTVFAGTLVALGILGLINGDRNVLQPVPTGAAAREVLNYFWTAIPVACGIGLFWVRKAAFAARVLLAYFLLSLLVFRVPGLLHGLTVDVYWSLSKSGVMLSAA